MVFDARITNSCTGVANSHTRLCNRSYKFVLLIVGKVKILIIKTRCEAFLLLFFFQCFIRYFVENGALCLC